MEKIKNILGLVANDGNIKDRFTMAFIKAINRMAYKLMNSIENLGEEEKEIVPLGKRMDYLGWNEEKAYKEALRILAKLRPEYKKYLPQKKKDPWFISDLLKRKIRLSAWVGIGHEIPFRELNEAALKTLLKKKGYFYRRDKLRWYDRSGRLVGKDLFEALVDLEKHELVDRSRLTIKF
ncbi:MAG: hypothetical protein WC643_01300 [Parcubacteria group bacterium]|jgi:hypothetical protein